MPSFLQAVGANRNNRRWVDISRLVETLIGRISLCEIMAFISNLTGICIVIFAVTELLLVLIYNKGLHTTEELRGQVMVQAEVEIVLQINGKVRDKLVVAADLGREEMQQAALAQPRVQELTAGKTIVKTICVPGKLVNIVVK